MPRGIVEKMGGGGISKDGLGRGWGKKKEYDGKKKVKVKSDKKIIQYSLTRPWTIVDI